MQPEFPFWGAYQFLSMSDENELINSFQTAQIQNKSSTVHQHRAKAGSQQH